MTPPKPRTKLLPTSTSRFNELPPIPGLEAHHFDIFKHELFEHPNKSDAQSQRNHRKVYRLGRMKKIALKHGDHGGPIVTYYDLEGHERKLRLKQQYLLLNLCPDNMFFFNVNDGAFRLNVGFYWELIKPAVSDWWWTARFQTSLQFDWQNRYGFVFRSETDAILCSQIIETAKPPAKFR